MTLSTRWLHLKKKYSGAHPRSSSRPIAGSQISSWHSPSSMECGKGGGVSHQEAVRRSHEVRPIHQGSHSLGHPLCPPSQPGTVPQNPTLQYWGWGRKQEVPHPHTPIGPSQPGIVPENPTHWSFRAHSRELLPPPPGSCQVGSTLQQPTLRSGVCGIDTGSMATVPRVCLSPRYFPSRLDSNPAPH